MKNIKLQSDIISGITLVDAFDEHFDELIDEYILLDCLRDADCLPLYAVVNEEMVQRITDYGFSIKDLRREGREIKGQVKRVIEAEGIVQNLDMMKMIRKDPLHEAAPELLEALKNLIGAFETNVRDCDKWVQYEAAQNAIAKATGGKEG